MCGGGYLVVVVVRHSETIMFWTFVRQIGEKSKEKEGEGWEIGLVNEWLLDSFSCHR